MTRPAPTLAEQGTPTRRCGRLVLAAALILGLTALGWWLGEHRNSPAESGQALGGQPPVSSGTSNGSGSPSVVWEDFAGLALPTSDESGPLCRSGGRAWCFAHTDDGAALAAVNILVRTFPFAGSAVFEPTIREQVTGADGQALARLTSAAYQPLARAGGLTHGEPIRSDGGWVAGYQIDTVAETRDTDTVGTHDDGRVVRVLLRQSGTDGGGGFVEYTVRLVWRDGDWLVVAPAWGDWRSSALAMAAADPGLYVGYDTIGRP